MVLLAYNKPLARYQYQFILHLFQQVLNFLIYAIIFYPFALLISMSQYSLIKLMFPKTRVIALSKAQSNSLLLAYAINY